MKKENLKKENVSVKFFEELFKKKRKKNDKLNLNDFQYDHEISYISHIVKQIIYILQMRN